MQYYNEEEEKLFVYDHVIQTFMLKIKTSSFNNFADPGI